jgi:DNA-binding XRE family transcriptional regulator
MVRELLRPLSMRQIVQLADLSGVSAHTIYKIKRGETLDPGLETCGKFLPHVTVVIGMAAGDVEG